MRCQNCGWENTENTSKCEKCNSYMKNDVQYKNLDNSENPTIIGENNIHETISEKQFFSDLKNDNSNQTCPQCGYPYVVGTKKCPNCDYNLEDKSNTSLPNSPREQNRLRDTVMGGPIIGGIANNHEHFCTLRRIAWDKETITYNPESYTGEIIILNRSNTDPNNHTITSKEQAVLTYEKGNWYIENQSDHKSTFIRVTGKTKLNNGDIIVLGNREFEFKF